MKSMNRMNSVLAFGINAALKLSRRAKLKALSLGTVSLKFPVHFLAKGRSAPSLICP